jgi:hypothetical protein
MRGTDARGPAAIAIAGGAGLGDMVAGEYGAGWGTPIICGCGIGWGIGCGSGAMTGAFCSIPCGCGGE